MRRIVVAFLVGVALTVSIQAGAAELLKGSKVAGTKEVTIGGQGIGQAAIINNTSYLPIRALSDALRLKIDLSGGKINLSEPTPTPTISTPGPQSTALPETTYSFDIIQGMISSTQDQIVYWERMIEKANALENPDKAEIELFQQAIDGLKKQLTVWERRKEELESQK